MKNKTIITALTALTVALAYFKPETTPIATAAVTNAITQLASREQRKDHGKP